MYVILEEGDEILPGDKFLSGHGGYTERVRSGDRYLRKLTGWAAVKHALKAEVLGNDKEGCETTTWAWDCDKCETGAVRQGQFHECPGCGKFSDSYIHSRKAEVILEIIEEK